LLDQKLPLLGFNFGLAPVYPYPAYIGSVNYYDYNSEYGAPDYYWYYCSDPEGYYPYITNCNVAWEPVPPTPGLE